MLNNLKEKLKEKEELFSIDKIKPMITEFIKDLDKDDIENAVSRVMEFCNKKGISISKDEVIDLIKDIFNKENKDDKDKKGNNIINKIKNFVD